mmetsp:Transcript_39546/g.92571  ORF Transcript_39546/g.92571 Transcript_39546/m.92571 type:complete len:498 (-) Transcript_39546:926-2419(-)
MAEYSVVLGKDAAAQTWEADDQLLKDLNDCFSTLGTCCASHSATNASISGLLTGLTSTVVNPTSRARSAKPSGACLLIAQATGSLSPAERTLCTNSQPSLVSSRASTMAQVMLLTSRSAWSLFSAGTTSILNFLNTADITVFMLLSVTNSKTRGPFVSVSLSPTEWARCGADSIDDDTDGAAVARLSASKLCTWLINSLRWNGLDTTRSMPDSLHSLTFSGSQAPVSPMMGILSLFACLARISAVASGPVLTGRKLSTMRMSMEGCPSARSSTAVTASCPSDAVSAEKPSFCSIVFNNRRCPSSSSHTSTRDCAVFRTISESRDMDSLQSVDPPQSSWLILLVGIPLIISAIVLTFVRRARGVADVSLAAAGVILLPSDPDDSDLDSMFLSNLSAGGPGLGRLATMLAPLEALLKRAGGRLVWTGFCSVEVEPLTAAEMSVEEGSALTTLLAPASRHMVASSVSKRSTTHTMCTERCSHELPADEDDALDFRRWVVV